jgi:hypothetical protein
MSASQGYCLKCNEINAYRATACVLCGARLPWANTVTKAAAIVATGSTIPATPAVEAQGFSAFAASPAYRYVVIGVLSVGAAAAYFVVDGMASHQLQDAMSAGKAPRTTAGSPQKVVYPKP